MNASKMCCLPKEVYKTKRGGKLTDEKTKISQQIYANILYASGSVYAMRHTGNSVKSGSCRKRN